MSRIAIIPARGGSKRIPGKNIKLFEGQPIIAYSIKAAIASELFDEVMVSTDDWQIAEIAKKHDAKVPFLRSPENSGDFATTASVLKEVIHIYKTTLHRDFSRICCIYPTAPLTTAEKLKMGCHLLESGNFESVFPVVKFGYPIWRGLKMNADNTIAMIWPENLNKRSQDLTPAFHDAGQWYWLNAEQFAKTGSLWMERSHGLEVSEMEVQDIDNEVDWQLAELKYKLMISHVRP